MNNKKLIIIGIAFILNLVVFGIFFSLQDNEKNKPSEEELMQERHLKYAEEKFYNDIYDDLIKEVRSKGLDDLDIKFKFKIDNYNYSDELYNIMAIYNVYYSSSNNISKLDNEKIVAVLEDSLKTLSSFHNKTFEYTNDLNEKISIEIIIKSQHQLFIKDNKDNIYKRTTSSGHVLYYKNDELLSGTLPSNKDYDGKTTTKENYSGCYPSKPNYVCFTHKRDDRTFYQRCRCE